MRAAGVAAGLSAAVVALAAAGCGGSGSSSGSGSAHRPGTSTAVSAQTTSGATSTRNTGEPAARRGARRVAGPPVGTRQAVHANGADLTVTVLGVLSLRHTRTPALPQTRQVGVPVRIANDAGQTYDSTSSGDVSLVLSHGSATPLDVRAGPCTTPLVDFESEIVSGDVRSGCVAFSVPRGARVLGVRFSPHSRAPGTLSWRVG